MKNIKKPVKAKSLKAVKNSGSIMPGKVYGNSNQSILWVNVTMGEALSPIAEVGEIVLVLHPNGESRVVFSSDNYEGTWCVGSITHGQGSSTAVILAEAANLIKSEEAVHYTKQGREMLADIERLLSRNKFQRPPEHEEMLARALSSITGILANQHHSESMKLKLVKQTAWQALNSYIGPITQADLRAAFPPV